jgi:hypothetical protein
MKIQVKIVFTLTLEIKEDITKWFVSPGVWGGGTEFGARRSVRSRVSTRTEEF